jgi:hypothetical protein
MTTEIVGAKYGFDYFPKTETERSVFDGKQEVHLMRTLPGEGRPTSIRVGEGPTALDALGNLVSRMIKHGDPADALQMAFDLWVGQYNVKLGDFPPGMRPEYD